MLCPSPNPLNRNIYKDYSLGRWGGYLYRPVKSDVRRSRCRLGGFRFSLKRYHFNKYLGVRLCWGTPRPNKGPLIGVSVILFKSWRSQGSGCVKASCFLFSIWQKFKLKNEMLKNFQRRRLTVVEQGSLGDHGEELEGDLHLHVRLVRRKGEKEPLIKR